MISRTHGTSKGSSHDLSCILDLRRFGPFGDIRSRDSDRPATGQRRAPDGKRAGQPAEIRTCIDISGSHHREGSFVELNEGQVRLRLKDGSIIPVPLEKLSKADQLYVKSRTAVDAAAIQGHWICTQSTTNGKEDPSPGETHAVFTDKEMKGSSGRHGTVFIYQLDPKSSPKRCLLKVAPRSGETAAMSDLTVKEIYELQGDTLKLAMGFSRLATGSSSHDDYPHDFAAKDGRLTQVYRRASKADEAPGPTTKEEIENLQGLRKRPHRVSPTGGGEEVSRIRPAPASARRARSRCPGRRGQQANAGSDAPMAAERVPSCDRATGEVRHRRDARDRRSPWPSHQRNALHFHRPL